MSLYRLFKDYPTASLVLIGLILLLSQGCVPVSPAAEQSTPPTASDTVYTPLVAWVAVQPPDRHVDTTLNDPEFGDNVSVRVESHYLSAMGLPCRRARISVVDNGSPAETVAVCQENGGRWFLAPRIWKSAAAGNGR